MDSRMKDAESFAPSLASSVDKQSSSNVKMLPLHNRLQQEAEKIRKWKIQTELEIKYKERKLLEANQTVDALRKGLLELQLQNESLSIRLQEEIDQKEDIWQRVESTRDMCNLLKNFAANVGERIDQCEVEKQEMERQRSQQEQQLSELCDKFHSLEIVITEKNQLAYQLEQERTEFCHREKQQTESLTQNAAMLQKMNDDCNEKESIIQLTRSQLIENQQKLEKLNSEHACSVREMENSLTSAKIELDQIGLHLHEALERETAMLEKVDELEKVQQIKSAELARQLELTISLEVQKVSLEKELIERTSELGTLRLNLQMAAEEKIVLSQQIEEALKEMACLDESKRHEIQRLRKEVETLEQELREKTEQINSLRLEFETCERQRLNVSDQLSEVSTDKSMAESEVKIAKNEASRLKKELEKLMVKHQELDQYLKEELKKAYSKVEQEQTCKIKLQEDLSRQLSDAQCEREKLVQDLAKQEQMFQEQLTANGEKQNYFSDQIDELKADRTVLETKIVVSREETANAKQTIELMTDKLKDAEQFCVCSIAALNEKLKSEQESHRQTEDKFKSLLAAASKEADDLKMEVKVLTQGKESAEKQIKSMGCQMAMSLDSYKKGYDDILTRKEIEFDGRMQLINKQNEELKCQLETTRREKEATELKAVAESARVMTLTENSRWELDAAISAKTSESEEMRRRLENLQSTNDQKDREMALMKAELQAALVQNESKCLTIACKDKELDEYRKVVENLKTAVEKQKATGVALLRTPVLPKERRIEMPKSKDIELLPRSKTLTVEREPSKNLLLADRSKTDIHSRTLPKVQDGMITPHNTYRSIMKKSLTSTTRKRKEISFTSPQTDESSSDVVVMQTEAKMNLSQIKQRSAALRRDGKIFSKMSPVSKPPGGSSLPSKLAKARKQASALDWFDNDSVFGFGAED